MSSGVVSVRYDALLHVVLDDRMNLRDRGSPLDAAPIWMAERSKIPKPVRAELSRRLLSSGLRDLLPGMRLKRRPRGLLSRVLNPKPFAPQRPLFVPFELTHAEVQHVGPGRSFARLHLSWQVRYDPSKAVSPPTRADVEHALAVSLSDAWGERVEQSHRFGPCVAYDSSSDRYTTLVPAKKHACKESEDGRYAALLTLQGAELTMHVV